MDALVNVFVFGLVGGIIGYVTNRVAVWMLFHPVRPRCLWRLCVRGLVPARRREIAWRLARVAAERLAGRGLLERGLGRLEEALMGLVEESVAGMLGSSGLGAVAAIVAGPGAVERIARRVAEALAPRLAAVVAEATRRIDVAELVAEEVMSMSVDELEQLFREVAGRELRFIEAMGFVLGFLVGLVEGVVALLL